LTGDMHDLTVETVTPRRSPRPVTRSSCRRPHGTTWAAFCARTRRLRDRCESAGARWTVETVRHTGGLDMPAGDYVTVVADSLPFAQFDRAE
jgi:hypothetical protein